MKTTNVKNPKTIKKFIPLIEILEPYMDGSECDFLLLHLEERNDEKCENCN
jgi:hypothetical protein